MSSSSGTAISSSTSPLLASSSSSFSVESFTVSLPAPFNNTNVSSIWSSRIYETCSKLIDQDGNKHFHPHANHCCHISTHFI